jgi:hypothetical protein
MTNAMSMSVEDEIFSAADGAFMSPLWGDAPL